MSLKELQMNQELIKQLSPEDVTDQNNITNKSLIIPMSTLMALNPMYDFMKNSIQVAIQGKTAWDKETGHARAHRYASHLASRV